MIDPSDLARAETAGQQILRLVKETNKTFRRAELAKEKELTESTVTAILELYGLTSAHGKPIEAILRHLMQRVRGKTVETSVKRAIEAFDAVQRVVAEAKTTPP